MEIKQHTTEQPMDQRISQVSKGYTDIRTDFWTQWKKEKVG